MDYFECRYCKQVVQGFEAALSLPQPCPNAPDHAWKNISRPVEVEGEREGETEWIPLYSAATDA